MPFYHLRVVQKIRTLARNSGLLRPVKYFIHQRSGGYEDAFAKAMLANVTAGACVWDIGANIGFYTVQFCDRVGATGKVIAFEPQPLAFQELAKKIQTQPNGKCEAFNAALSEETGKAQFEVADLSTVSVTARLFDGALVGGTAKTVEVDVRSADDARDSFHLSIPTVTKIDVEGYELDVLRGGKSTFASPLSKHIFIEVHFERLDERNMPNAPKELVDQLKAWGYRVRWIDASHLHAFR